jgi:hypothetical protein
MKVARHEMPGKLAKMIRPTGNGGSEAPDFDHRRRPSNPLANRLYRTLRDEFLDGTFPGISCLATFIGFYGATDLSPRVEA